MSAQHAIWGVSQHNTMLTFPTKINMNYPQITKAIAMIRGHKKSDLEALLRITTASAMQLSSLCEIKYKAFTNSQVQEEEQEE